MKVVDRLLQELRNIVYEFTAQTSTIESSQLLDVPFVGQYARQEHAEVYVDGKLRKIDDPYWRDSGASSPGHYAMWASALCGMACTAMCIKFFLHKSVLPITLAEDALLHGVYKRSSEDISAMNYREYAAWVHHFNLLAQVNTRLSFRGICYAIANGKLAIVSVNPRIREKTCAPKEKGGHLVLAIGYNKANRTITIHNPSGFVSNGSHMGHTLSFKEFEKYYAGRGIIISAR